MSSNLNSYTHPDFGNLHAVLGTDSSVSDLAGVLESYPHNQLVSFHRLGAPENWRIQLNNATATLNDMERVLGENTTKIQQFSTAAGSSEVKLKDAAQGADKIGRDVD